MKCISLFVVINLVAVALATLIAVLCIMIFFGDTAIQPVYDCSLLAGR